MPTGQIFPASLQHWLDKLMTLIIVGNLDVLALCGIQLLSNEASVQYAGEIGHHQPIRRAWWNPTGEVRFLRTQSGVARMAPHDGAGGTVEIGSVEQGNDQWLARWYKDRPEVAFGGRTATKAVYRLTGPDEKPETWLDRPPML